MFSASAQLYDPLYGAFKDFAAEARAIAALIHSEHPSAHSILDVGCGTAEHAKHLHLVQGFVVDGLDLDPGLLSVAKAKLPDAHFVEADMANFELHTRYDVILCLFSSIGYALTLARVAATLSCFHRHLRAGGLVVVEPWFEPGVLQHGPGTDRCAQINGMKVTRSASTRVHGRTSTLEFTYHIEECGQTTSIREEHILGLFTQSEMHACFAAAGLSSNYQQPGLAGRGLYIARRAW